MNLKAEFGGDSPYYSSKRLVPGDFNMGLISATCTALTGVRSRGGTLNTRARWRDTVLVVKSNADTMRGGIGGGGGGGGGGTYRRVRCSSM